MKTSSLTGFSGHSAPKRKAQSPKRNQPPRITNMTRELVVGTGAGLATTDMVLNVGPQHPSTHGVLRLKLVLDGELVISCEPIVGYMHRGAEKLFEVRDYRQI